MTPKRYIIRVWMGFNPAKGTVRASKIATKEVIKIKILKTVSLKLQYSASLNINDNRLNLFFFSLCFLVVNKIYLLINQDRLLLFNPLI